MANINKRFLQRKKGSAFIVVIGVLAIIIFAATMFMTSTIEEGRHTTMSIRGLHATSLAEAALERSMTILSQNINSVKPSEASADDFGIVLRLPGSEGSSSLNQGDSLGTDKQLTLSDAASKEIVLDKDALQPGDNDELDKLVEYMTDKGAKSYEVTVKVKVANAFRNSPGKGSDDMSNFKVPGVDIGWNTRLDVKSFLEGKGYTMMNISFPAGWTWLDISIPVEILPGVKITDINVVGFLDAILPDNLFTINGKSYSLAEITTIDFLAARLLNDVIGKGKTPAPYPIKIPMDKVKMPSSVSELWPSGVSVSEADGQYLEKYGQISFEAEAKITYNDGQTTSRRVSATKDFKVADCEPPAPMYSFFIANFNNNYITFNNYGGQFYVNNYDFSGILGKLKTIFTGAVNTEEGENNEIPGLIRVNYVDSTANKTAPLLCNVSIIGDTGAPTVAGDDSGFLKRAMGGMEACLIANSKSEMAVCGAEYNIQSNVVRNDPETNKKVPVEIKGKTKNKETGEVTNPGFPFDKTSDYSMDIQRAWKSPEWLSLENKINLVPNVAEMSCNILSFTIAVALKPIGNAVTKKLGVDEIISIKDCFQKWEMPYMGDPWNYCPIPNTGLGTNKTHLFGYSGLHPTLTKEIEGNVMKVYRQWAMCIVGMKSIDRLPLLPFPPTFMPPFPVPFWKSDTVLRKYGYSMSTLGALDDNGQVDNAVHEYDPSLVENMPPNLYTNEQYAKKATYYYEDAEAFQKDFTNRTTTIDGKTVFVLNGITYISGSLGSDAEPFSLEGVTDTLYVVGKGMIVCSGNFSLGFNIETLDRSENEKTVFSLICRNGGLLCLENNKQYKIEGSLYTDKGIYIMSQSSLNIIGNWVTNDFNKPAMRGTVVVDYVSSRLRSSLGSLHPTRGKYDPQRYYVTFSPIWASWRAY